MKEKGLIPYFNLASSSGITDYVKFWLDEHMRDPREEPKVLEKLKVVFSNDSPYQIKILYGNTFGAAFRQRLGKRRLRYLAYLLSKIDSGRYREARW
jgi:hypothetical protein